MIIESVLYISSLDELKLFEKKKYTRLYFGNEHCENLFPEQEQIRTFFDFCEQHRVKGSLVVPWCTQALFGILPGIFRSLPKKTEIIFNDWGTLLLIKRSGHTPVLGRMLVSIKRDPRMIPPQLLKQSRASNLDHPQFLSFLKAQGIQRIELDNVQQGYSARIPKALTTSIYYPNILISTTRKCPFAEAARKTPSLTRDYSCVQECRTYGQSDTPIDNSNISTMIQGNALLYTNNTLPTRHFKQYRTSRIVESPRQDHA